VSTDTAEEIADYEKLRERLKCLREAGFTPDDFRLLEQFGPQNDGARPPAKFLKAIARLERRFDWMIDDGIHYLGELGGWVRACASLRHLRREIDELLYETRQKGGQSLAECLEHAAEILVLKWRREHGGQLPKGDYAEYSDRRVENPASPKNEATKWFHQIMPLLYPGTDDATCRTLLRRAIKKYRLQSFDLAERAP
jgi:hypothetical protein